MRKRRSRPYRFAAVENDAIDQLSSILGVGLLTRLIRAKDGDDVTVESLAGDYEEGEKALTKAMRTLVEGAYVVKFKIQRATSEAVIEDDGTETVKRGGSWYTTFTVDSVPFTAEDVEEMLTDIYAEGNVKSYRVEPTRLDPRGRTSESPKRPTPPFGGVGATCGNAGPGGVSPGQSGPRPTPPRAGVGQGGAHIRKKTVPACAEDDGETGEAVSPRSGGDGRRPSDGSSVREVASGCAASGGAKAPKQSPTTSKPKHTRAELATAAKVRAYLPAELAGTSVPALTTAILAALADGTPEARTVEQLGERIGRRWYTHGWAEKVERGERIERPVGVAIDLVRAYGREDRYGCPNPRCEDGADVDTGEACTACPERMAQRKAARRSGGEVPGPRRDTEPRWECGGCGRRGMGQEPPGGLCRACRDPQDPAPAQEPVEEAWEPSEADLEAAWAALLEEAYAEHDARCRPEIEEREAREAKERQRREEAAERDRLRKEIARQYPELAASSGPPPF